MPHPSQRLTCRLPALVCPSQVREACQYEVKGGSENKQGKANVLLQVGGGAREAGGWAWRQAPCTAPGAPLPRPCRRCNNPSCLLWISPFRLTLPAPQAYISRARVESFSLTADLMYVSQVCPAAVALLCCCIAAPAMLLRVCRACGALLAPAAGLLWGSGKDGSLH